MEQFWESLALVLAAAIPAYFGFLTAREKPKADTRGGDTVDNAQEQMRDLLKTLLERVARLEEAQEELEAKYNFSLAALRDVRQRYPALRFELHHTVEADL
ncbi:hypothetical protein [Corynebacterium renale]|uniref:hypothetical protein n=1 Tax=Corynebacterium renale TaxID=1724 RepID=UPI000E0210C5|nr:hypothetical protein [Corynebacterium renale]STC97448.1 Uncharacterised protein [Corynebacterium renale]STD70253.1 Uncharacterised protein [Corynebacterium renale]